MERLSPMELQVVRLVGCQGMRTEDAAREMHKTHNSVRNATSTILSKTGARRLSQAVYLLTVSGELDIVDDRPIKAEDEIEHRLACIECGHVTKITHGESLELVKKLSPRFPADTLTIECPCGKQQFVMQARRAR